MYKYVRPLLFKMDEEKANNLVVDIAETKLARFLSKSISHERFQNWKQNCLVRQLTIL